MPSLIFRKGLDMKGAVAGILAENYHSHLVDDVKANGFVAEAIKRAGQSAAIAPPTPAK